MRVENKKNRRDFLKYSVGFAGSMVVPRFLRKRFQREESPKVEGKENIEVGIIRNIWVFDNEVYCDTGEPGYWETDAGEDGVWRAQFSSNGPELIFKRLNLPGLKEVIEDSALDQVQVVPFTDEVKEKFILARHEDEFPKAYLGSENEWEILEQSDLQPAAYSDVVVSFDNFLVVSGLIYSKLTKELKGSVAMGKIESGKVDWELIADVGEISWGTAISLSADKSLNKMIVGGVDKNSDYGIWLLKRESNEWDLEQLESLSERPQRIFWKEDHTLVSVKSGVYWTEDMDQWQFFEMPDGKDLVDIIYQGSKKGNYLAVTSRLREEDGNIYSFQPKPGEVGFDLKGSLAEMGLDNVSVNSINVNTNDPEQIYLGCETISAYKAYYSQDGGSNWREAVFVDKPHSIFLPFLKRAKRR